MNFNQTNQNKGNVNNAIVGGAQTVNITGAKKPVIIKKKPVVVGTETVKAKCGHELTFELFPDKQDKYRSDRRRKLTDRPCGPCRQEADRKRQEEQRAKRPPKPPKQDYRDRAMQKKGRLPIGSNYDVTYTEDGVWSGFMTVQGVNGEGKTFSGTAGGVIPLLFQLDDQYRKYLELGK